MSSQVRGVMLNSKLPMEILGKIWDLADMDKDGSLDRVEFSIVSTLHCTIKNIAILYQYIHTLKFFPVSNATHID